MQRVLPFVRRFSVHRLIPPCVLEQHINKMNQHDDALSRIERINKLLSWQVLEDYKQVIKTSKNDYLLSDLSFIRTVYNNPLMPYQKINVRNQLFRIYEDEVTTALEKSVVLHVMKHYDLLPSDFFNTNSVPIQRLDPDSTGSPL